MKDKAIKSLQEISKDITTLRQKIQQYGLKFDPHFVELNGVNKTITDLDQLQVMIRLEVNLHAGRFDEVA